MDDKMDLEYAINLINNCRPKGNNALAIQLNAAFDAVIEAAKNNKEEGTDDGK